MNLKTAILLINCVALQGAFAQMYSGGSGDGSNIQTVGSINLSTGSMFIGGNQDGASTNSANAVDLEISSQFSGGNNDGVSNTTIVSNSLEIPNMFSGGNNDGISNMNASSINLNLSGTSYSGGSNDGITSTTTAALTLQAPSSFSGGNNDGISSNVVSSISLLVSSTYSGGNNDGISSQIASNVLLNGGAIMFSGGSNDGFGSSIQNVDLALSGMYAGGSNDGWGFENAGVEMLPVDFLTLIGNWKKEDVHLVWTTTADVDIDAYDIERSFNGNQFNKLGTIKSKKSRFGFPEYVYTDIGPATKSGNQSSFIYYRIKSIENNVVTGNSETIIMSPVNNLQPISIYPNPAGNELNINLGYEPETAYYLRIHTYSGQTVLEKKSEQGNVNLKIDNLFPGVYFLEIQTEATIQNLKFIIK